MTLREHDPEKCDVEISIDKVIRSLAGFKFTDTWTSTEHRLYLTREEALNLQKRLNDVVVEFAKNRGKEKEPEPGK